MRIISGKHRGKHFIAPNNLPVRPTTDYAKESFFNIVNNNFYFDDIKVLDLFAGTGSITYEFTSRGCTQITCVDQNIHCINFIKKMLEELKADQVKVVKNDVISFLKQTKEKYDLIFCDPPFDMPETTLLPTIVFERELLNPDGWLVVDHPDRIDFAKHPNVFDVRQYGQARFTFFSYLKEE